MSLFYTDDDCLEKTSLDLRVFAMLSQRAMSPSKPLTSKAFHFSLG